MEEANLKQLLQEIHAFAEERDWTKYHSPKNLAIALSVEASELLELFTWLSEEEAAKPSAVQLGKIKDEIADVFVYLLEIAGQFDIDLVSAAAEKMRKNAEKYPAAKVKGSHKKYDEY